MAKKADALTAQELRRELARVAELQQTLASRLAGMTSQEKIEALEKAQPLVDPETPEMEALLMAGYPDMSVEKARRIVAEYDEKPERWPYETLERAQAFLAAYSAKAVVRSDKKAWRRVKA